MFCTVPLMLALFCFLLARRRKRGVAPPMRSFGGEKKKRKGMTVPRVHTSSLACELLADESFPPPPAAAQDGPFMCFLSCFVVLLPCRTLSLCSNRGTRFWWRGLRPQLGRVSLFVSPFSPLRSLPLRSALPLLAHFNLVIPRFCSVAYCSGGLSIPSALPPADPSMWTSLARRVEGEDVRGRGGGGALLVLLSSCAPPFRTHASFSSSATSCHVWVRLPATAGPAAAAGDKMS